MIFLRPYFLLLWIPVAVIAIYLWFRPRAKQDWRQVADLELLAYFSHARLNTAFIQTYIPFILALFLMVFSLAGPSWHKQETALGHLQKPVVIVLDLSKKMLLDDLSPSRLERAKFLLQDVIKKHPELQWSLLVYSSMPFVVTPLTSDIENILTFLPLLNPEILPVGGQDLAKAVLKAKTMLEQADYASGKILILSSEDVSTNQLKLWAKSYDSKFFLIEPGIDFNETERQLNHWLNDFADSLGRYHSSTQQIAMWRDEGLRFLWPAVLILIMIFRKGWFLRLWV